VHAQDANGQPVRFDLNMPLDKVMHDAKLTHFVAIETCTVCKCMSLLDCMPLELLLITYMMIGTQH